MSISDLKSWAGRVTLSPLVVLLILVFYTLPGAIVRFAQAQFFQLGAVLLFCFALRPTISKPVSDWSSPMRWLVLLALSQLLWVPVYGGFLFAIQQLILGYLFFEVCVMSEISFNGMKKLLAFLVIPNFWCAVWQKMHWPSMMFLKSHFTWLPFNIELPPLYLMADTPNSINGIWGAEAFQVCAAIFTLPFLLSMKTKWKWFFVVLLAMPFWWAKISFGRLALAVMAGWYAWLKLTKREFALCCAGGILFVWWWISAFEGGISSADVGRFQVWGGALKEMVTHNRIFNGFGIGYYFLFGKETTVHIFRHFYFFAQTHNEYLQAWFEMGIIGLAISIWFVGRTMWFSFIWKKDFKMLAITTALIGVFVMAFGQPVFHMTNINAFAIALYALMEVRKRKLGDYEFEQGDKYDN